MPQARVLLGTEVVMDFMNERQPFYQQTRMLMVAGRVGEFDLWVTAPQVVDLVYLLSEGGKPELLPRAMERIRGLRTFVQVADLTAANVDRMLASSGQNPEGQLMVNAAIDLRADFLLTHEPDGLENGLVKVTNVPGMFEWLCENRDLDYTQIEIKRSLSAVIFLSLDTPRCQTTIEISTQAVRLLTRPAPAGRFIRRGVHGPALRLRASAVSRHRRR